MLARSAYLNFGGNVNSLRGSGLDVVSRGGVSSGTTGAGRDANASASVNSRRRLGIKGKRRPTTSAVRQ